MAGIAKRFVPNTASIGKAPYFNMNVHNMKAWQLYVGQSLFLLFVCLFFYALKKLITAAGVSSPSLMRGLNTTKAVISGKDIEDIDRTISTMVI